MLRGSKHPELCLSHRFVTRDPVPLTWAICPPLSDLSLTPLQLLTLLSSLQFFRFIRAITNSFFPLIFPHLPILSFVPSHLHPPPSRSHARYTIYSSAKAFSSFGPCLSITPLEKPRSWIKPPPPSVLPITATADSPASGVALLQTHSCHLRSHCCPPGLCVCLVGFLSRGPQGRPSLHSSPLLLMPCNTPQAVKSPPISPRNGATNILQPPANLPACLGPCLPLTFHSRKVLLPPPMVTPGE